MKKYIWLAITVFCLSVWVFQPVNKPAEALVHFGYANVAGIELSYEKAVKEAEVVIEQAEASPEFVAQNKGAIVAAQALTWRDVHYRKGVPERCAEWVRHVLELEGIKIPTAQGSLGPLMADSLHAPEQGTIILDPSYLAPGDLVMFSNTYNGGGRFLNGGKITHVGIYVGNGMMMDRPTRNATVQYRPLSTFKFNSALRPNAYNQ